MQPFPIIPQDPKNPWPASCSLPVSVLWNQTSVNMKHQRGPALQSADIDFCVNEDRIVFLTVV